ncbi:transcriptional regulator [Photorhabdus temperata]|uniref:cAMP-binding protein n=2 Tax=Photorhabdus khanii TaxID=1004150 RepID=W3V344_9GAMM|nr:Crp/Fnr family transcriptional regulator [Photorhabdus khanii]ETS30356.1 cAMP-binding protein [Photorhabdus khanii NC19]MQL46834.1 cyclic nucleotide-binding domain-containing protein [Photorhabdus khanii]OHV59068.1 transcriptional regulator [Photorhabdus temperata]
MCRDKERKLTYYVDKYHLDKIISPELMEKSDVVEMKKNVYLTHQLSKFTHLYILVEGKLKVEYYNINGKFFVFALATPLFLIGDLELFHSQGDSIMNTISAQEPSVLLSMPLERVKIFGLTDPRFLEFVCKQLSNKLFESSLLQSGAFLTVEDKLKRFLYYNAKKKGSIFVLEKRENLAAILGVSVRQLNRAIKSLNEKEIIMSKNKQVKIIDCRLFGNNIEF